MDWSYFAQELASKHAIEGKKVMTGRRGRRRKQLPDDLKETKGYWKFERRSTRSHSVENSLWKRLWICRETDCGMNEEELCQPFRKKISQRRQLCMEPEDVFRKIFVNLVNNKKIYDLL
jgi:hypothetical protein